LKLKAPDASKLMSLRTGTLAAAGRKRRGFKEGVLAYGALAARGFVNGATLTSRNTPF